jgi:hypothetical protein
MKKPAPLPPPQPSFEEWLKSLPKGTKFKVILPPKK